MQMIEFADDEVVPIKELTELYESVGWHAYADDPDSLARAIDRSDYVVTARNGEGALVGLARCLTDDVHVLYLQDVLIRPDHQRQGIGGILVSRCVSQFDHVRQKVLMTDDRPELRRFYESLGFVEPGELGLSNFVQIS